MSCLASAPVGAQWAFVPSPPPCEVPRARQTQVTPRSVAVVSLFLSSTPSDEVYLSDALAEALARRLSKDTRLEVRSREAVRRQRPVSQSQIASIAREVGARFLVLGSLAQRDGRRIAELSLYDSAGARVWSQAFDISRGPWVAERDGAIAVAERVAGSLPADVRRRLGTPPTSDPVAYDRFLRGLDHAFDRTAPALEEAVAAFGEAARRDSTYAETHARLALAWATMLDLGMEPDSARLADLLGRARATAERAVRLDSTSAEAWTALGAVLAHARGGENGARAAFARAVKLDPGAGATRRYGTALVRFGDRSAGEAMLRRAAALAPENASAYLELAELSLRDRRYEEACRLLDQAVAAEPYLARGYVLRALVRAHRGDLRYAWADAEIGVRQGSVLHGEAVTAYVDARARDTVRARERARRLGTDLLSQPAISASDARFVALALVAGGDRDRALTLLERAAPRGPVLDSALRDPGLAALQSDARFRRIFSNTRASRRRDGSS